MGFTGHVLFCFILLFTIAFKVLYIRRQFLKLLIDVCQGTSQN